MRLAATLDGPSKEWVPGSGWVTFQNCATDASWFARQYDAGNDHPAPGGGNYALRLHTTGFAANCQSPGVYADSPKIAVAAGRTYVIESMTRNATNYGQTQAIFYDANDRVVPPSPMAVNWSHDTWAFNADAPLTVKAPAGATKLSVRYALRVPGQYADIDLLRISVQ